jgi:hypothetical protein
MRAVLADLLHLLDLERIEENIFRGESRDIGSARVFGGQVLGQAERGELNSRCARCAFAACVFLERRRCECPHHL